jgi:hypothetical protein
MKYPFRLSTNSRLMELWCPPKYAYFTGEIELRYALKLLLVLFFRFKLSSLFVKRGRP